MSGKHLHIISFIVPYPVNYGGVFDIYNKIVALHKAGIKIYLHCFTENNIRYQKLSSYCEKIYYYPRRKGIAGLSFRLPYIVSSRMDSNLWSRLNDDEHPVLIEGIHSAGWLLDYVPGSRKVILRLHNVEHTYYRQLFLSSSSTLKKLYYHFESLLLKRFERNIAHKPTLILAVSEQDVKNYKEEFKVNNIEVLQVFTGFSFEDPSGDTTEFCLYHGNLSVPENEKAVAWLLQEVFSSSEMLFVIAGKNPSPALKQYIARYKNAQLISNPSIEKMQSLVHNAQCNVLPSFNLTGVKLKIINALFHGRHCIVNKAAVQDSGLEAICHIANSPEEFRKFVHDLYTRPLAGAEVELRRKVLKELFDEQKNCEKLIRWLW